MKNSTSPPRTQSAAGPRNGALIVPLSRPRLEPERDGEGTLVILGNHGSLFGDRRQALREFRALEHIERWGSAS